MINYEYNLIGFNYKKLSDIPKDVDIFYHCYDCKKTIPSLPKNNLGCGCGNIFIDKDYLRLIVADLSKFAVVKRVK